MQQKATCGFKDAGFSPPNKVAIRIKNVAAVFFVRTREIGWLDGVFVSVGSRAHHQTGWVSRINAGANFRRQMFAVCFIVLSCLKLTLAWAQVSFLCVCACVCWFLCCYRVLTLVFCPVRPVACFGALASFKWEHLAQNQACWTGFPQDLDCDTGPEIRDLGLSSSFYWNCVSAQDTSYRCASDWA